MFSLNVKTKPQERGFEAIFVLAKLCNYNNMGRTKAQKEPVPIIVKEASVVDTFFLSITTLTK